MNRILQSTSALQCLNNEIKGANLYHKMRVFARDCVQQLYYDFNNYDVIIVILRAGLPLGMYIYEATNKPLGFISAKRKENLEIEITYENIPKFENPLIVDSWIATGSTIKAVCEHLNIKDINLFGLVASKQAMRRIKAKNYIIGYLVDRTDENNYLIPPSPYLPRDGGDDLFINTK